VIVGRFCVLLTIALAAACRTDEARQSPISLTIATGSADGVYYPVGRALAEVYSRLPGVAATTERTTTAGRNLEKIQRGTVDLAFDGAGFAYAAFNRGTDEDPRPHSRLRAIAVVFSTSVQIAARVDSGISRVEDLRGRRIGVGAKGGATDEVSELILAAHGLTYQDVKPAFRGGRDLLLDTREGRLDAFFLYAPSPQPIMADLTASRDVRLVPITRDGITRVQARSPFLLKTVVLPAGTYAYQTENVSTVGADILLICRVDLPDGLVHDLTRELFAARPQLIAAHPAAGAIDVDRGPAASIPLHPGAARYYRERELPR
jgi:TRAP transporter TAXI family solute receptor